MKYNGLYEIDINRLNPITFDKRDCYKELSNYIYSLSSSRICALYGLRRTGKTIMMQQMAKELIEKGKRCRFYDCTASATMDDIDSILEKALQDNIKYIFIDEITSIKEFQECSSILADVYAAQGLKIIIAGTDSLSIMLAGAEQLYDRIQSIHTSYISFGEFHRLLSKDLNDYILYGGTLTNTPYKNKQDEEEYYNTAIVNNIIHSLENSEGLRKYPPTLTELYENEEIVSTINKMIDKMNQNIVLKAVLRDFKNGPMSATIRNSRNDLNYKRYLDIQTVINYTKAALDIKDKDEMKTKLSQLHLEEIKYYLKKLDLLLCLPVYDSLKTGVKAPDLELLLQPGMVYSHAVHLMDILTSKQTWLDDCKIEDRHEFIIRAENYVKGFILENQILANTYLNFKENEGLYISKLHHTFYDGNEAKECEADMIVVDKKTHQSYLFEVKYSRFIYDKQVRHLVDYDFIQYIGENFEPVAGRYLIYNGETKRVDDIQYINAEQYFKSIYELKTGLWKDVIFNIESEFSKKSDLSPICS